MIIKISRGDNFHGKGTFEITTFSWPWLDIPDLPEVFLDDLKGTARLKILSYIFIYFIKRKYVTDREKCFLLDWESFFSFSRISWSTNCFSMFDHFVGLAFKGLKAILKQKLFNILRNKEDLILKIGHLMKWSNTREKFSWKKYAENVQQKLVLARHLILVNNPKYNQCIQVTLLLDILRKDCQKSSKNLTCFFF